MQLLMKERVDEKFSIFSMQVFVDAYNAAFEVSLAVIAHPVVDEPAGTRHALSVFEEHGAARRWVLVAKELEGGAAVMSLLDQNGVPRRAVRRNNRTDAWLPFSLELSPAVPTLLGEVTYWLKQAKDAPK